LNELRRAEQALRVELERLIKLLRPTSRAATLVTDAEAHVTAGVAVALIAELRQAHERLREVRLAADRRMMWSAAEGAPGDGEAGWVAPPAGGTPPPLPGPFSPAGHG
jgi:hypothetical protein